MHPTSHWIMKRWNPVILFSYLFFFYLKLTVTMGKGDLNPRHVFVGNTGGANWTTRLLVKSHNSMATRQCNSKLSTFSPLHLHITHQYTNKLLLNKLSKVRFFHTTVHSKNVTYVGIFNHWTTFLFPRKIWEGNTSNNLIKGLDTGRPILIQSPVHLKNHMSSVISSVVVKTDIPT